MGQNSNILIVDDDEDILTAGRLLLRRQFGSVITCSDPEQVPEILTTNNVDVVLLDLESAEQVVAHQHFADDVA